jgi:hypothetical protein
MSEQEATKGKLNAQKTLLGSLLTIDGAYIDTSAAIDAYIKSIGELSGELAMLAANKTIGYSDTKYSSTRRSR